MIPEQSPVMGGSGEGCLTSLGALQTSQQVDPALPHSLSALLAGGWGVSEGQDLGASEEPRQDDRQSLSGLCLQLLASHAPVCAPPLILPSFSQGPKQQRLPLGRPERRRKAQHGGEGRARGEASLSMAQTRCFLPRAEPFQTGATQITESQSESNPS